MTSPDTPGIPADAQAVLDFWLADGLTLEWPSQDMVKLWFGGGPAFDAQIDAQFGPLVRQAVAGGLQDWEGAPLSRLALVILLDQFTRNVFRGKPEAFAGDARAQALVQQALAAGEDAQLPLAGRIFLYMPLEHAEDLAQQHACVRRFEHLAQTAPAALQATFASNVDYAHQHRDIIAKFGRFPHRNAALGRASTDEEIAYLKDGQRFGQ
jgi:uncharacterized protein (DUF924 family)